MGDMSLGKILIEFGVELGDLQRGLAEVKSSVESTGKETEKQGTGLADYAQKWFFVKGAVMDMANFMKGMVAEYANQERAINSLNLALGNQGNLLPGVSQALQEQASALQRTTTFADEAITKGQSFLAMAGMTGDQIRAATPAILDYAAATGIDVTQAFQNAMRGSEGMDRAFKMYGISVDDNLPKSERLAQLTDQLSGKFGGMAEVIASDGVGAMERMTNAVGEAKEGLGKFFQFAVESTTGGGGSAMFAFFEGVGAFFSQDLVVALGIARQGWSYLVATWLEGLAMVATPLAEFGNLLGVTTGVEQVANLQALAEGFRVGGDALRAEAEAAAIAAAGNQDLQEKMEGLAGTIVKTGLSASELADKYLTSFARMRASFVAEAAAMVYADREKAAEHAEIAAMMTDVDLRYIDGYHMAGGLKQAEDAAMAASARALGVTMKSESAATLAKLRADFAALTAANVLSTDQRAAAEKKLLELEKQLQNEKKAWYESSNLSILQNTLDAMSSMGKAGKIAGIASATISTLVGMAKALEVPWPASIVAFAQVAAMGWGVVSRIRSFSEGTPGLDFANFGSESPAMLHGSEAVIPRGGGHGLADEIAGSLAKMPSGDSGMSVLSGASSGGGQEVTVHNQIQAQLVIDGKVLAEQIEELTKTGRARVHPTAVKEF
jgi:hypothetical protein